MKSLRRYLMHLVWGREARHLLKRRRRPMLRKGPARNARYRAWIRTLPCLVCGQTGAEAAHTGDDGGLALKSSDYSCVPLCADCHTMRPDSYHRHPGGREGFERQHNLDLKREVKRLNEEWRQ